MAGFFIAGMDTGELAEFSFLQNLIKRSNLSVEPLTVVCNGARGQQKWQ
jgi:hypothetical protein